MSYEKESLRRRKTILLWIVGIFVVSGLLGIDLGVANDAAFRNYN